jgi:baculoviral IAP repeat-containing protein 7/8
VKEFLILFQQFLENAMPHDKIIEKEYPIKKKEYSWMQARIASFELKRWKRASPTPLALAQCGFYFFGGDDICQCFYCGIKISRWDDDDNVWVEHATLMGYCPFLRINKIFIKIIEVFPAEKAVLKNKCTVCWQDEVTHAFLPCSHLCVCRSCVTTFDDCPVCRQQISGMVKIIVC